MILTLADDLSGAAEAGGIALRFGLAAEVQTEYCPVCDVDVIVVDTDSRNCSATEAARRVEVAYAHYRTLPVRSIFKKVDSVLRGNVLAEIAAILDAGLYDRTLLVPANPGMGRTVLHGRYWVDNQPLDQTDFANDPEYPAGTSDVRLLLLQRDDLGVSRRWPVTVVARGDRLPAQGIVVGEARSDDDLLAWAKAVDASTVAAGGAEFMDAFLQALGQERVSETLSPVTVDGEAKTLFVCGSTSASSRQFCRECEAQGIPVVRMPAELLDTTRQVRERMDEWTVSALAALREHPRVVIAIDRPLRQDPELPQLLTSYLGAVVERVLDAYAVGHLLVEGGATAAALVHRFGWTQLRIVQELAPGVVSTRVSRRPDLVLTMKPGSYRWPDHLLR